MIRDMKNRYDLERDYKAGVMRRNLQVGGGIAAGLLVGYLVGKRSTPAPAGAALPAPTPWVDANNPIVLRETKISPQQWAAMPELVPLLGPFMVAWSKVSVAQYGAKRFNSSSSVREIIDAIDRYVNAQLRTNVIPFRR